ncbi:MAG: hypothetical protein CMK89_00910 [Pseudomonadales bacterium]|nr:hypothetical protein [Pseudomonadales bacterium]RLU03971.1 MAG: GGDEF domain-containing protein [Ketobacter sp.]
MLGAINTYLSSATPTQRVIVSIWLNLPFLFVFIIGLAASLLIEEWRALLNPFYISSGCVILTVCACIQILMLIRLWPRRRELREIPVSVSLLAFLVATALGCVAILGGNLTYPTNLVMITVVPIGLLLLGLKAVFQGAALGALYLLTNDYLLYHDLVPYAPAYSPQAFETDQYLLLAEMVRTGILYTSVIGYGVIIAILANQADYQREGLIHMVRSDSLTGIANRRHFIARLEQECARQSRTDQPLCLAMIDADHFKKINDRYGHAMGDEVLVAIAEILRSHMRVPEDLPARLGGEEFAILFIDTDLEGAKTVCRRIQETLAQTPFLSDGEVFHVTLSIGLVEARGNEGWGVAADELLSMADDKLYQAKALGRDTVVSTKVAGDEKFASST